jgi:hypothetical protein
MYRFRSEDGVPGGLIIWAVFIIVFAVLGVPAPLAILLGGFGGAAVGFIQIYWRAEKDEGAVEKQEEESPIRPTRSWVERFPLLTGFGLNRAAPQRITRDPVTGEARRSDKEPLSREGSPIRARRPKSSFSDAVKRRKEGSR